MINLHAKLDVRLGRCLAEKSTLQKRENSSMSTQRKAEFVDGGLSEEMVHDYLEQNEDFFERNGDLLGLLRLPHVAGGTVSLVERQVSVLRQKDLKLERKLKELLSVARANDSLAEKLHTLTLALFSATDLAAVLKNVESALRRGFDADQSILVLFGDPELFKDIKVGRFFRPIDRTDGALKAFDTFLQSDNPRCGQVRDSQRDFLFGEGTDEIGSVALVPLGAEPRVGFLAIGSADAERFHPGMSIDFLSRFGDLIAGALKRF
jgi:uncharacterized protein YigA (DUF484 family)